MEESLFAYSLSQSQDGWTWRLWDESGAVVAAGDAPDQLSAQRALEAAYEETRGAGAPRREPRRDEPATAAAPAAAKVRARLAGHRPATAPRPRGALAEARQSARS